MFGGVDALVESQDWWLRDQASLAVGFDNWEMSGIDQSSTQDSGVMTTNQMSRNGMAGIGGGFFMPGNGNSRASDGNAVYGDDEWYS